MQELGLPDAFREVVLAPAKSRGHPQGNCLFYCPSVFSQPMLQPSARISLDRASRFELSLDRDWHTCWMAHQDVRPQSHPLEDFVLLRFDAVVPKRMHFP